MTVFELIRILENKDQDAPVLICELGEEPAPPKHLRLVREISISDGNSHIGLFVSKEKK